MTGKIIRKFVLLAGLIILMWVGYLFFYQDIISQLSKKAYNSDLNALQTAVNRYKESDRYFGEWPTFSNTIGDPYEGIVVGYQCTGIDLSEECTWIDMEALFRAGLLSSSELIRSANTQLNISATNSPSGQYGWYLNSSNTVSSIPKYSDSVGYP